MSEVEVRILHAEDNESIRTVTAAVLARAGYSVDSTMDGREATMRMEERGHAYNLVITDSEMPDTNGREFVSAIRNGGYVGPIIVLAGTLSWAVTAQFLALGVTTILLKGMPVRELLATVRSVLKTA